MQLDDPTPGRRPLDAVEAAAAAAAAEAAAAAAAAGASADATVEAAARAAAEVRASATAPPAGEPAADALAGIGERPVRRRAQGPIRARAVERIPFAESRRLEKEWWLRLPLLLVAPTPVFSALRDDRDVAAEARQEPMLAVLFLASLSIFFMSRTASKLYDSADYDAVALVLEAVVTVPLTIALTTFVGGLGLRFGLAAAGATVRWRQARHLLGLAQLPLLLPLVTVFPLRLALYGSDLFRSGGSDGGTGSHVFDAINLVFVGWSVALLVLGARTVWRWSVPRTLAALVPGLVVIAAVAYLLVAVDAS